MARGTRRVEVRVVVHVDQDRMAGGSVATAICSGLIGVKRTEMRGRVGGAAAMVARIGGHSAIGGCTWPMLLHRRDRCAWHATWLQWRRVMRLWLTLRPRLGQADSAPNFRLDAGIRCC